MRATYQIERLLAAQNPAERPLLTSRDVLEMATIDGARAMWMEGKTGSLTPGKQADVIMLRTDAPHLTQINDLVGSVVLAAHPRDVDTVFVAGRMMKRGGVLLGLDLDRLRVEATASRDAVVEAVGQRTAMRTAAWRGGRRRRATRVTCLVARSRKPTSITLVIRSVWPDAEAPRARAVTASSTRDPRP